MGGTSARSPRLASAASSRLRVLSLYATEYRARFDRRCWLRYRCRSCRRRRRRRTAHQADATKSVPLTARAVAAVDATAVAALRRCDIHQSTPNEVAPVPLRLYYLLRRAT